MSKTPIRVAIVGIGNCASSMVQSCFYYDQWDGEGLPPGVMNWDLGGYTPRDILPVAVFDVLTNFSSIDVKPSYRQNVSRCIPSQIPIHDSWRESFTIPLVIVKTTLHHGTGTIPNANYCYTNGGFAH
jgi:myo-inositol-1-phosphate synthase